MGTYASFGRIGAGTGSCRSAVPMVAVPAGVAAATVGAAAPIAQFVLFDSDEPTPPGESATAAMFYSAQRVIRNSGGSSQK